MMFEADARSPVSEPKRGTSWFSLKVPSRLGSWQESWTVWMVETRSETEPEVDLKASIRGK